mgnify:CR=1 FL=1
MDLLNDLTWNADDLLPAVVQDAHTQQVLMLGWMNAEALQKTLLEGYVTFWSRSRSTLWRKGESSGNLLVTTAVAYDCDADALLVQAAPLGPTCHTGNVSCFYRQISYDDALLQQQRLAGAAQPVWSAEAAQGADTP